MTPKYRKKVLLKALFNDPPVLTNLLHSIVKWKGTKSCSNSEHSHWVFNSCDFALQTISVKAVISHVFFNRNPKAMFPAM